jgi:hypothetical protein
MQRLEVSCAVRHIYIYIYIYIFRQAEKSKILHITVFSVQCNLSIKLKNYSFYDKRLYDFSSVFCCEELILEVSYRILDTPCRFNMRNFKSHKCVSPCCNEIGFINACGSRHCP